MQMNSIFKEFENLSVEKRRFRLRWDSSPGLSITERFSNSYVFEEFEIFLWKKRRFRLRCTEKKDLIESKKIICLNDFL